MELLESEVVAGYGDKAILPRTVLGFQQKIRFAYTAEYDNPSVWTLMSDCLSKHI